MRSSTPYSSINNVPGVSATQDQVLWKQWMHAQTSANSLGSQAEFINTTLTGALPTLSQESLWFWDKIIKTTDNEVQAALVTPYKLLSPTDSLGYLYWHTDYSSSAHQLSVDRLLPECAKIDRGPLSSQFVNCTSDVDGLSTDTGDSAAAIYKNTILSDLSIVFGDVLRLSPLIYDYTGTVSVSSQSIKYSTGDINTTVDNFYNAPRTFVGATSTLKA